MYHRYSDRNHWILSHNKYTRNTSYHSVTLPEIETAVCLKKKSNTKNHNIHNCRHCCTILLDRLSDDHGKAVRENDISAVFSNVGPFAVSGVNVVSRVIRLVRRYRSAEREIECNL